MTDLYIIYCKEREKFMEEDKYKTLESLRETKKISEWHKRLLKRG